MDALNANTHKRSLQSRLRWIFVGPFGLRSGWRFLLFLLLAAGLVVGLVFAAKSFDWRLAPKFRALIEQASAFIGVFAATWILARIERKPVSYFGLVSLNRSRNLFAGVAAGFLSLSLLMILLIVAGGFRLGPLSLRGSAALAWGLFWLLVFTFVGFTEELMSRGYPLFALSQGIGFWPAAILMSALFGAGHLGNKGEDYIGIAAAMLAGVVLAFSLRWTGSLWWAIGYHLSWDWAETFFYGVSDSGQPSPQHFLSGTSAGPSWLSGGSVGPEGSILAIPILLLLAAVVRFTSPRAFTSGLERLKVSNRPPEAPSQDELNGVRL
ncbi:MAG: CPBP family intramembrane metalloprotease [Acidobacteriaceae bacterium]|nr:CPBP family intramembrane metalloprotease [Acidobacteriaceae bacterium]MBV9778852.1 CPBP family intramembrane metalloprotease [Acidobacteriaceae bacterium]